MIRPFSARHSAFSLIEVSVALVIFVIGAVALLRIFPPGLGVIESSGNRRTGYKLAQNLLTRYDKNTANPDAFLDAPDAIYHAERIGSNWTWSDVRGAMISRERSRVTDANIGSAELPGLPRSPDDFRFSMLDKARYISGERQRVAADGTVALNFIPEGARVSVFREGLVKGIALKENGQLDFVNAEYLSSYHSTGNGQPFRQAIIESQEGPVVTRQEVTGSYTATVPLRLNIPNRQLYMNSVGSVTCDVNIVFDATGKADATDVNFTPQTVTFNSDGLATISFELRHDLIEESGEYFRLYLSNARGASIRDPYINIFIPAHVDLITNTSSDWWTSGQPILTSAEDLLPVRAPNELRGDATTFYVSYRFDGGGVRSQPMKLPLDDAAYPQNPGVFVPHSAVGAANFAAFEVEFFTRFRTALGNVAPESGARNALDLSALNFPEMGYLGGSLPVTNLSHVALDYNVYDWRFISEYIPNFTTPYPANTLSFAPVTNENAPKEDFLGAVFELGTYQNAREIRTSIGNLHGPIYRTLKAPNGDTRVFPALDARTITLTGADAPTNKKARAVLKTATKEGRLMFDSDDFSSADRAIINYRSADDWVQQLSVTAHHYLPFESSLAAPREEWREYVRVGNKLYFRASEAGKRVAVLRNLVSNPYEFFTVDDKLIDPPTAIAGFSTAVAGEAVGGKVAVCDLESATTAVFDVAAPDVVDGSDSSRREVLLNPRGTTGMMGRVAWLFNGNYEQEILR